jgi:hypothetical protein
MATATSATSATPLVDAYVADPMRVPPGFIEWARSIETTAREVRQELGEVQPAVEGQHLDAVQEAIAEIDAILDDSPKGLFRRVLSRPPWQLRAEDPARSAIERRLNTAAEFARQSMQASAGVRRLSIRMAEVRSRYGRQYPGVLAALMERARLRDSELLAIRREVEVRAAERRVDKVIRELSRRDAAVIEAAFVPEAWTVRAEETATAYELASTCALALADRARRDRRRLTHAVATETLARHLESIDVAAVREPARAIAAQGYVLEDLLRRAGRVEEVVRLRAADAPLWCAALANAADEMRPYRVQASAVRSSPETAKATEADEHSYFLVPLDDDLVLVSKTWKSVVRLWNDRLAIGADVDGQIVADRVPRGDDMASADIQRLFNGVRQTTAWYTSHARVRITVVAHFDESWVGRIVRQGEVRARTTEAWKHLSAEPSEFRIVVAPEPSAPEPLNHADVVAAEEGLPCEAFAGFTTTEVRTSLGGDEIAWRRNPSGRGKAAVRAIEAEWQLFHAMYRGSHRKARALVPLAWTAEKSGRERFPLYRMPLGVAAGTPQFESIARLNLQWRLFTIREIAKCLHQVHRLGYVLGTVHPAQFVYGVEPNGHTQLAVPRPILVYAPAVVRVGEAHVAGTRLEQESAFHERLRTPLLNPFAATGAAAATYHDIYSFGVCALELLAVRQQPKGVVFYNDLRDVVRKSEDQFASPKIALRIADAISAGPRDQWLTRLYEELDSGLRLDAEDWLAVA